MKSRSIDPRYDPPIPPDAIERIVSEYRRDGNFGYPRTAECWLDGILVGVRCYDADGALFIETPMKDGANHGVEYRWHETGELSSSEPYFEGKVHGQAKQWGRGGSLWGTYTLVHGTGYDLFWNDCAGGAPVHLSEVHSMRDGLPHGFERWLRETGALFDERHWRHGTLHGIERSWNASGRLCRGYPRYWVDGERVDRRRYLRAATHDATLPPFRDEDQSPARIFPPEVRRAIGQGATSADLMGI